jgi:hypothetical protein
MKNMAPLKQVLLFAVCLEAFLSAGGTQRQAPPYSPGRLESFLATHKDATIFQKELGNLKERDKASFSAVVAWDSSNSDFKYKGIRINLEEVSKGRVESIYLDEEGMECSRHIRALAKSKNRIIEDFRKQTPEKKEWYTLTFANNRVGDASSEGLTALNLGWYKSGDEIGVVVNSAVSGRQYFFPGAELGVVADMLDAGRSFLDEGRKPEDQSKEK